MDAVDEWIPPGEQDEVVYVALHACGSLTPSILRAILQGMKKTVSGDKQNGSAKHSHRTRVRGAVIVGCCYNLMEGAGELSCPLFHQFIVHLRLRTSS